MQRGPPNSAEASQTGKYRVLLELGQGGTAIVYLAVAHGPVGFNKLVVLKAMKSNIGNDQEFRRMFLNEARLSARLNHPNIVQVNEVIEYDGMPVIVMEYLEGKPLSEIRTRVGKKLDLHMHLRILSEALGGLHYSHELSDYDGTLLQVVHRDMTPHNIFVTYEGQVKVLDFGIAKLSGSVGETQTGVIKGKLRYMPPEQITAEHIDRRADIFAAGVMIWEAVTGTRMWGALSEAAIMNKVLSGQIPSPREVNPEVSPELERICAKALAHDPNDRYATAAELQADIEAALGKLSSSISMRDIGQFVVSHFEQSRVQTRKLVEQHLSSAALGAADTTGPIAFLPNTRPVTLAAHTTSETYREDPKRFGHRTALLMAVAAILAAVTVWALIPKGEPEPERNLHATTGPLSEPPVPSPSEPEEEAPKNILVRVTAFPLSAEILLDGKPVKGNPYMAPVPLDEGEHQIEARAEGYVTSQKTVTFEEDVDVVLTLEKEQPKQRVISTRRWTPPPAPKPAPVKETPPGPDCNPPYYVDEKGLKKFKPGCI